MKQVKTYSHFPEQPIVKGVLSLAVAAIFAAHSGSTHALSVDKADVADLGDRVEVRLLFDEDIPDNVRLFTLGVSPRVQIIDFPSGLENDTLPLRPSQADSIKGLTILRDGASSRILFEVPEDLELHSGRSGKALLFRLGGQPFVSQAKTRQPSPAIELAANGPAETGLDQIGFLSGTSEAVIEPLRVESSEGRERLVISVSENAEQVLPTLDEKELRLTFKGAKALVQLNELPKSGRYYNDLKILNEPNQAVVSLSLNGAQHLVTQQGNIVVLEMGRKLQTAQGSSSLGESPQLVSARVEEGPGATTIRFGFSAPLKKAATGFSLSEPARHVVDFQADVKNMEQILNFSEDSRVGSAQLLQTDGKARLVLGLRDNYLASQESEGNDLVVRVSGPKPYVADSGAAGASASIPASIAAQLDDQERRLIEPVSKPSLRGVSSRVDASGNEIISFEFDSEQVIAKVDRQGDILRLRAQGARLASGFVESGVDPYGKYFSGLGLEEGSQSLNVSMKLRDALHQVRQNGTTVDLLLRHDPSTKDGPAAGANVASRDGQTLPSRYSGKPISLNFKDADIKTVLQVFADFTDMNVVLSDGVKGTATVHLKDVPWDQALDIVLQSRGLVARNSGKVLLVMTAKDAAAQSESAPAERVADELEPLVSQSVLVSYQKTGELVTLIRDEKSNLLSRRGRVIADERTSQLFLEDTPARVTKLLELIRQLDKPVRQVMIEAKVVLADTKVAKELSAAVKAGRISLDGSQLTQIGQTPSQFGDKIFVDSTREAAVNGAYTLLTSGGTRFVNLQLKALEEQSRIKTVSNPRVITTNKEEALIEQGTEIPYQVATSSGATSTEFREANLKLQVTPQIAPDGSILLDVDISKDSVGQETAQGLAINTRHVRTKVSVANGGTVVLGGIFEKANSEVGSKVPVLGDIPVLGHLFKGTSNTDSEAELLIFLTPVILGET